MSNDDRLPRPARATCLPRYQEDMTDFTGEGGEWFRTLAESIPQLVWTCQADGPCDYLSPQWVDYTGIPEAAQLGSAWLAQLHPDDQFRVQTEWAAAAPAGQPFDIEFRIRRHDGVYRWFKTRATPLLKNGRVKKWVGTNTDIEELRDAEAALLAANLELEARVRERTAALAAATAEAERKAVQLANAQRVAKMGSWELDVPTGRVMWTDQLFRTMGLPPAPEAPPFPEHPKMFTPESWQRLGAAIEHSIATGASYELDLEVVRKDGVHRWCVARAETARGPNGKVTKLMGTFEDFTELKELQQVLAKTTARMQLATAAAGIGVWDLDLHTNALTWDAIMHELYGVALGDFTGVEGEWRTRVHPDDIGAVDVALRRSIEDDVPFDQEFRIFAGPQRAVRYVRGAAVVHRDVDGRPQRLVGVNWEVTDRRLAELALRANEALLREFVKHAPAAIAMLDTEVRYIQASDRWLHDYNLGDQNIIGRSHYEIFPDIPQHWKDVHQRVLRGAIERCDDDPFPRADGGMEWLQWEARPWRKSTGEIGGLLFFTNVITARKALESALRQQKTELERSNDELRQFAYVASHDLQEPLRAVSGCSQLLVRRYRGKLDPAADELLTHIIEGSERMHLLIRDLLAYSHVGRREHDVSLCDADAALQAALANLQIALEETRAVVTFDPLPKVWVDPTQLTQLFQNLVGNAMKYRGPEPPRVHIGARAVASEWEFRVTDNGIGIAPEYHERIFNLFQRLHTRAEYPGTGIGLALCKKIVQGYGGRIWVESSGERGSAFCFTLPAEQGGGQ